MISIIIPVYNVEDYLEECLNSCITQTYQNLEILAIDDGSTDKSSKILDDYAAYEPRLKVFHQVNKGVVDARNLGISEALGEWIVFLDSDDFLLPNALEVMLKEAEKFKANIVIGGFISGSFLLSHQTGTQLSSISNISNRDVIEKIVMEEIKPSLCAKLFHKSQFNEIPKFKNKIYIGEDYLLTLYLLKKECDIILINTPVYFYRIRKGSMMNSPSLVATYSRLYFILDAESFFADSDLFLSDSKKKFLISLLALREFFSYLRDGGDVKAALNVIPHIKEYIQNKKAISKTPFWRVLIIRLSLFDEKLGKLFVDLFVFLRKYSKR